MTVYKKVAVCKNCGVLYVPKLVDGFTTMCPVCNGSGKEWCDLVVRL